MTYKILLLCANGMSTRFLMMKMKRYAKEKGINLSIQAAGISSGSYKKIAQDYDFILIAPQISYQLEEVKKNTGKSIAAISAIDYARSDTKNIFAQIKDLYKSFKYGL